MILLKEQVIEEADMEQELQTCSSIFLSSDVSPVRSRDLTRNKTAVKRKVEEVETTLR